MKLHLLCLPIIAAGLLGGCSTTGGLTEKRLASAIVSDAKGVPVGTVQIVSVGQMAALTVAVTGIAPGPHGFHLHAIGDCTAPDFKSAGGHLNPLGQEHGSLNPAGKHLGDLNNLEVGASGAASETYDLPGDREQLLTWLFDSDGTAVVIHAAADDYKSDPAGNAGSRIACGVLKPA